MLSLELPSGLSLISLLGSMLEDPGKLCVVKHAILDRSLSVHLINFIISKPVSRKIVTIINIINSAQLGLSLAWLSLVELMLSLCYWGVGVLTLFPPLYFF